MTILKSFKTIGQSITEVKVKKATDDDENNGATGSLMNEISVLTYSPKTLGEIVQVIRKRLTGSYKKTSHKNAVHILKTLTLISYLLNNGSTDFILMTKQYIYLIDTLVEFSTGNPHDIRMVEQIRSLSIELCNLMRNEDMLRARRRELREFRTSISTPGRKSLENNYLSPQKNDSNLCFIDIMDSPSNKNIARGSKSLDIKRTVHNNHDQLLKSNLGTLTEEDEAITSGFIDSKFHNIKFSSNNPFR